MAITIQMIETKEFTVVNGEGYDQQEVDEFLDAICDEFDAMQQEMKTLRAAAERKTPTPATVQTTPAAPTMADNSEAIRTMLTSAQHVYDETIAEAKKRADEIIRNAEAQSESIVGNARGEAAQLHDDLDNLRSAALDYRARFTRLVEDQMHVLNADTELFKA